MKFKLWLETQRYFDFMKTPKVSAEKAKTLFGPVYHGTNQQENIDNQGFKVLVGRARTGDIANGFELFNFADNVPPPTHFIGFGVYFTTIERIANRFGNSKIYYLDVPRLEVINFASPKKMMTWWQKNGYNMPPLRWKMGKKGEHDGISLMGSMPDYSEDHIERIEDQRVKETLNLTNTLKAKYDAVWFKGKGFGQLLDGDQVCVFDPLRIYELDTEEKFGQLQLKPKDKVRIKNTTATGIIAKQVPPPNDESQDLWHQVAGPAQDWFLFARFNKFESLRDIYKPLLMQNIPKFAKQWLELRIKNSPESNREEQISQMVDYILDKKILPDSIIEKLS